MVVVSVYIPAMECTPRIWEPILNVNLVRFAINRNNLFYELASEYAAAKAGGSQISIILGICFFRVSVSNLAFPHRVASHFTGRLLCRGPGGPLSPTFYLSTWNTEQVGGLTYLELYHTNSLIVKTYILILDSSERPFEIQSKISSIGSSSIQWSQRV